MVNAEPWRRRRRDVRRRFVDALRRTRRNARCRLVQWRARVRLRARRAGQVIQRVRIRVNFTKLPRADATISLSAQRSIDARRARDRIAPREDVVRLNHRTALHAIAARVRAVAVACHDAVAAAEHFLAKHGRCLPLVLAAFVEGAVLAEDLNATLQVGGDDDVAVEVRAAREVGGGFFGPADSVAGWLGMVPVCCCGCWCSGSEFLPA